MPWSGFNLRTFLLAKISEFKYKLAEISELKDELAEISEFQDELAKISELQDELASKLLGEEEIVETIEAYAGISTSLGRSSSQIVEPLGHDRHLLLVKELKKVNYDYECTICELLSTW